MTNKIEYADKHVLNPLESDIRECAYRLLDQQEEGIARKEEQIARREKNITCRFVIVDVKLLPNSVAYF